MCANIPVETRLTAHRLLDNFGVLGELLNP